MTPCVVRPPSSYRQKVIAVIAGVDQRGPFLSSRILLAQPDGDPPSTWQTRSQWEMSE